VVELDDRKMKASLLRQYTHPDGLRADAAGNVQVLPNGNVFVGWGRALYFSEFGKDGELLFDARLPQTGSTGPSASRGALSQAIGPLLRQSAPPRKRSGSTPAGTEPRMWPPGKSSQARDQAN
jgi:hypothetical protein